MAINRVRTVVAYACAAAALAVGAATATTGTADASNDTSSFKGCPAGAACLYGPGDWDNGAPEHIYWSYGVHQVHNEYGNHRLWNWQTGEAGVQVCRNSNGTDCSKTLQPGQIVTFDMTRINSIKLTA